MTGNKCVVDTSVVIHVFKDNQDVIDILDSMLEIYLPVIVIGELYFGANRSSNPAKHQQQIFLFLNRCKVVPVQTSTAEVYAQIKADLFAIGKPIPENDIWIAALAYQHHLPLFTQDKHFNEIKTITVVS